MERYKLIVEPWVLKGCREQMLEHGVEMTPEGLQKVLEHATEIAGYFSQKSITLEVTKTMDLLVDIESGSIALVIYDEESE